MKEHRSREFEISLLGTLFIPQSQKFRGGQRKMRNKELYKTCALHLMKDEMSGASKTHETDEKFM
jgi:hypothetical protein